VCSLVRSVAGLGCVCAKPCVLRVASSSWIPGGSADSACTCTNAVGNPADFASAWSGLKRGSGTTDQSPINPSDTLPARRDRYPTVSRSGPLMMGAMDSTPPFRERRGTSALSTMSGSSPSAGCPISSSKSWTVSGPCGSDRCGLSTPRLRWQRSSTRTRSLLEVSRRRRWPVAFVRWQPGRP
jgi:hypothetical protein